MSISDHLALSSAIWRESHLLSVWTPLCRLLLLCAGQGGGLRRSGFFPGAPWGRFLGVGRGRPGAFLVRGGSPLGLYGLSRKSGRVLVRGYEMISGRGHFVVMRSSPTAAWASWSCALLSQKTRQPGARKVHVPGSEKPTAEQSLLVSLRAGRPTMRIGRRV